MVLATFYPPNDGNDGDFLGDLLALSDAGDLDRRCLYWKAQAETCPETKKYHIHIFAQASRQLSTGQWQTILGIGNANCKPVAKDNGASDYVHKVTSRYEPSRGDSRLHQAEWGTYKRTGRPPGAAAQMQRDAVERVVAKESLKRIAEAEPEAWVNKSRGLTDLYYRLWCSKPRFLTNLPKVTVHYGKTGTGKSHTAFHKYLTPEGEFDDTECFCKSAAMAQWWDGYSGQKHCIIEEFRAQIPFHELLVLLDKYPLTFQIKTTSCQCQIEEFIITSPVHPSEWYPTLESNAGKMDQLKRRLTEESGSRILYFHTKFEDPTDVSADPWPHETNLPNLPGQFDD